MRARHVGCGPRRHAHEAGRRGVAVHGADVPPPAIDLAREDAPAEVTFERADARRLAFDGSFDAAISLCQGAFGLADGGDRAEPLDPDRSVLEGIARAVRPGGGVALSAFSAYFQVRWLDPDRGSFDAERGVNHERTVVKDETGRDAEVDLWTTCFTPRELRLLARAAGLEVQGLWSVRPGEYGRLRPDLEHEEFLLLARRPR